MLLQEKTLFFKTNLQAKLQIMRLTGKRKGYPFNDIKEWGL